MVFFIEQAWSSQTSAVDLFPAAILQAVDVAAPNSLGKFFGLHPVMTVFSVAAFLGAIGG